MTHATDVTQPLTAATGYAASRLGRNDPLLQELWAVKATMNAESGYSILKLAEQARQFDLDATLARLRQVVGH